MNRAARRHQPRLSHVEVMKQMENRKVKFMKEFPFRTLKFFAGVFLFIPITMVSFGVHCFKQNEWPWSNQI